MAAMDQGKLTSLCSKLNQEASNYVSQVSSDTTKIVEEFNRNWVSNAAQNLATEIENCLTSLTTDISNTFNNKNEGISIAVANFNTVEEESISYPGFSFGNPNVGMSLNKTLPNGKVGVADGADISSISTPMKTLVSRVNTVLSNISSAVSSCDAFDSDEVNALTNAMTKYQTTFEESMQELENSLSSRMSGEIAQRDSLNKTNVEILN